MPARRGGAPAGDAMDQPSASKPALSMSGGQAGAGGGWARPRSVARRSARAAARDSQPAAGIVIHQKPERAGEEVLGCPAAKRPAARLAASFLVDSSDHRAAAAGGDDAPHAGAARQALPSVAASLGLIPHDPHAQVERLERGRAPPRAPGDRAGPDRSWAATRITRGGRGG